MADNLTAKFNNTAFLILQFIIKTLQKTYSITADI